MTKFAGCLSDLPPQAEHLLLLRAGVGLRHPFSGVQVARMLGMTASGEALAENSALGELQAAARSGACGQSSVVSMQFPGQDHLVSRDPALSASVPAGGSAVDTPTGKRTAPQHAVSAAYAARRPAHRTVLENAVHLSTSTPALWFELAGLAVLGGLAVLATIGRQVATREPLTMAVAAAPASVARRPAGDDAQEAPLGAAAAAVAAETTEAEVLPDVGAPIPMSEAGVADGAAIPAAAEASPSPVPSPPKASLDPPAVGPGAGAANRTWLQVHRTHVALGITALSGAARLLARRRR